MHEGWGDHPFWRQVIDSDVFPVFVTYPCLHLYHVFLFRAYVKSGSEKNPFSMSISDTEHVSKRVKIKKKMSECTAA